MYPYKDIRKIHLEITQKCQAACPMCDRNERGEKINRYIPNAELSLADCKKIFTPEFIEQLSVLSMCGNYGDPIVSADTLEVFSYFRDNNPHMHFTMHTNGGARTTEWWTQLAYVFGSHGSVVFSVDGLRDTNHIYRQNVNWDSVENSMHSFISAGGKAEWAFIVFDHNQHQVEEARSLSQSWGFSKFTVKKSARFFSAKTHSPIELYRATTRTGSESIIRVPSVQFQNTELAKEQILISQFGSMEKYYDACNINCKVKKEKNLYVSADGTVLPCCWAGTRMYKWWNINYRNEPIWQFIDNVGGLPRINAMQHSLEDIVNNSGLFQNIESSWGLQSLAAGKLNVCAFKCGDGFDPFAAQVC